MRIFVKILPPINLTARLSCNTSVRRYTSLVQVAPEKHREQNLSCSNSAVKRSYGTHEANKEFIQKKYKASHNRNKENFNLPIAFKDWSSTGHSSCKILFIPLNWLNVNERLIRSSIKSIFLEPRNLQKIYEFIENSQAKERTKQIEIHKIEKEGITAPPKDQKFHLKDLKSDRNQIPTSIVKHQVANLNCLTILSDTLNKTLSQIFDIGVQYHPVEYGNTRDFKVTNNVQQESFTLSPLMKIYASSLKHKNMKLFEMKGSLTYNFPLTVAKKFFSTSTTACSQKALSEPKIHSKCDPDYNFPHLSKIFGTEHLLMRSDAYSQAIIEAATRRAALEDGISASKNIKNFVVSRPQVMNVKGCTVPKLSVQYATNTTFKSYNPCPPPSKLKEKAKDEFVKLTGQEEEGEKKIIAIPMDCEFPHFKNDSKMAAIIQRKDNCSRNDTLYKIPEYSNLNKTENEILQLLVKKTDQKDDGSKTMSDSSGKAKASQEKNPCLDEDKNYKPKCNEYPCKQIKPSSDATKTSPRKHIDSGKKNEPSCDIKQKEDPCKRVKKKGGPSKKYAKKGNPCKRKQPYGGSKQKEELFKKEKRKGDDSKKKNPCIDRKPKENPCKKDKLKEDLCKNIEPFGGNKQTEDSCKKAKIEDDSFNKKIPCGDSKPKEDPCKKGKVEDHPSKNKNSCEDSKPKEGLYNKDTQKEDPCKKKEPFGSSKQKEDPCKKQKEDASKNKNPCGDKKQKEGLCGSKKKDPCQDKTFSKNEKTEPCKTKNFGTCGQKKNKALASSQELKTDIESKGPESSGCGKKKIETKPNCGKDRKCFSTLATKSNQNVCSIIKRTLITWPSLRNKNFYNFSSIRHFSSKRDDKNKKKLDDLARRSQCKAVGTRIPPHRKPAYNPHPREGLRQCYPSYDMDCKKLCKDARKTDCKKKAFLKDTDNNKRTSK